MNALQSKQIVELSERLLGASPTQRAVALLAEALAADVEHVAALPIGRRDAGLLAVRRATYGALAPCFVRCPSCGAELEFDVDLDAIRAPEPEPGGDRHELELDGFRCRFRLPASRDLLALNADADAVGALLALCVEHAELRGDALEPNRLPQPVRDALAAEIGRLDPQADVSLAVRCDSCEHGWSVSFDIASYLFREIEVDARRLLSEVDALARAYGWSESEILALGRRRRRRYLELLGAA